jgi:hypothetical protein
VVLRTFFRVNVITGLLHGDLVAAGRLRVTDERAAIDAP